MNTESHDFSLDPLAPRTRNHRNAVAMIAGTAVMLAAFLGYAVSTRAPAVDGHHCRIGVEPRSGIYVLIDLTDRHSLSPTQLDRLATVIDSAAKSLAEGDRLDIATLAAARPGEHAELDTFFSQCRPRAPQEATASQGRHVLERELESRWTKPLAAAIDTVRARQTSDSKDTPLIAGIKQLRPRMAGRQQRLMIIGDMVELSDTINMYREVYDFRKMHDARMDAALVDGLLDGVDVEIFQTSSPRNAQLQARAQPFWTDWLAATRASVSFRRI